MTFNLTEIILRIVAVFLALGLTSYLVVLLKLSYEQMREMHDQKQEPTNTPTLPPADSLTAFLQKKYDERNDKDNMCCVGITDIELKHFLIKYLLGDDYCVVDPIGETQVNTVILIDILRKYSTAYQKERRSYTIHR